ncbi:hypothetical protein WHR41_03324 [Cladosporium halotolerans]|uniref:Uncharacterized protein n=1 Tax=Cladosporium halotolerans TaxID=1052096 RepID=A0AB34KSI1_9PEZI
MSSDNTRTIRYALLIETGLNLSSVVPMLLDPSYMLRWLFKSPEDITPAACTLMQWIGCIITSLNLPLLLAVPNKTSAPALRRSVYMQYAAGEVALGAALAIQYFGGNSGMRDEALLKFMGSMAASLAVRGFFLLARPDLLEVPNDAKKAQ